MIQVGADLELVTVDTYTQGVMPVKRDGQAKIANRILADVPAASALSLP